MESVDRLAAETRFSGVVRVDRGDDITFARAYGLANRAFSVPNTLETQFGIASGVKGLTALTVVSLIESGSLTLDTTARAVLGSDLPLIDDAVTVEHLLAHRSGIGDYFDEDEDTPIDAYLLRLPVHEFRTTEQYLPALEGIPTKFAPGERFSYCNSGFVVLALIAERVTGTPFSELVEQRVLAPAGMGSTAFLESDDLPGRAATGYLEIDNENENDKTNVFHLAVRGSGDGGIYSTAADIHRLWAAFLSGRIVSERWRSEMIRPRSAAPEDSMRYGLGFWLHESRDVVILTGYDAGVSFKSVHDPGSGITHTVISNTSEGTWPISRHLAAELGT